jgi:hypothetical protein
VVIVLKDVDIQLEPLKQVFLTFREAGINRNSCCMLESWKGIVPSFEHYAIRQKKLQLSFYLVRQTLSFSYCVNHSLSMPIEVLADLDIIFATHVRYN